MTTETQNQFESQEKKYIANLKNNRISKLNE